MHVEEGETRGSRRDAALQRVEKQKTLLEEKYSQWKEEGTIR